MGDVVCGGFAAPLKKGFGEKVLIVISEEIMSMYAAKNIVNVINQYKYNGIYLAGLIINKRDNEINNDYLDKFAQKIKADILATMPRSKLIAEAEYKQMTVVQAFPNSAEAELFADLAKKISSIVKQQAKDPVLISDEEFNNLFIK